MKDDGPMMSHWNNLNSFHFNVHWIRRDSFCIIWGTFYVLISNVYQFFLGNFLEMLLPLFSRNFTMMVALHARGISWLGLIKGCLMRSTRGRTTYNENTHSLACCLMRFRVCWGVRLYSYSIFNEAVDGFVMIVFPPPFLFPGKKRTRCPWANHFIGHQLRKWGERASKSHWRISLICFISGITKNQSLAEHQTCIISSLW